MFYLQSSIPSISCCKDCKDREIGCHGYCKKYIESKKLYEKRKKEYLEKRKEKDVISMSEYLSGGFYWRK